MQQITFEISFEGNLADQHQLDFYDVATALMGFQRTLALTAHLIANGEIITQVPALKNARILCIPPEEGSWKINANVILVALGGIFCAPHDSIVGNIAMSIYDYVLSEAVGVHVDYNRTIQSLIDDKKNSKITQGKMDSLIEKCESAISEIHRPIIKSETAKAININAQCNENNKKIGPTLNEETYEYIKFTTRSDTPTKEKGRISGYDSNTYKGRVFIFSEKRPIPFDLEQSARSQQDIKKITENLSKNAQGLREEIEFTAFREISRTGRLKRVIIVGV